MTELHHGSLVSVYDKDGWFDCRGHIVGINRTDPPYYDVQPLPEFSLKKRMCSIPASRVRAHYVPPYMIDCEAKHIKDEA